MAIQRRTLVEAFPTNATFETSVPLVLNQMCVQRLLLKETLWAVRTQEGFLFGMDEFVRCQRVLPVECLLTLVTLEAMWLMQHIVGFQRILRLECFRADFASELLVIRVSHLEVTVQRPLLRVRAFADVAEEGMGLAAVFWRFRQICDSGWFRIGVAIVVIVSCY